MLMPCARGHKRHRAQYGHVEDEHDDGDTKHVAPNLTDTELPCPAANAVDGDISDDRSLAQRRHFPKTIVLE